MPQIKSPVLGKYSVQFTKLQNSIKKNSAPLETKLKAVSQALKAKAITARESILLTAEALEAEKKGSLYYESLITALKNAAKAMARASSSSQNTTKPMINGHEYVLMGDGLKWAVCNIGASKPEERGDYFAWGETEPFYSSLDPLTWKGELYYGFECCKYFTHEAPLQALKYNNEDGKTVLELADDVARANWKGTWRMPTDSEVNRLMDENNFTWKWETKNGVEGYTVTSKVKGYEGNSIFLPGTGSIIGKTYLKMFTRSSYWTASMPANQRDDCIYASFMNLSPSAKKVAIEGRYQGYCIRAVSE